MNKFQDSWGYAILLGIFLVLLGLLSGYMVLSWHAPTALTGALGLLFLAAGVTSVASSCFGTFRRDEVREGWFFRER